MTPTDARLDRLARPPFDAAPVRKRRIKRRLFPPLFIPIAALAFLLFGTGANDLLGVLALAVAVVGTALLWRPGEAPILLYIFAYQWLQATVGVFYGNWSGRSVVEVSSVGGDTVLATVLSTVGVLALGVGMRIGAGGSYANAVETARQQIYKYSQKTWFLLFIASLIVATLAQFGARQIPGLSQPLLALASFEWAGYFMFTMATFVRKDSNYALWFAAFAFELALSLGAYFSNFSAVFMFTGIALIASKKTLSRRTAVIAAILFSVLMVFALAWTAVKVQYRAYLSGGAQAQVVVVDYSQSVSKLIDLLSNLDGKAFDQAARHMVSRVWNVDYFARALVYVPNTVPFQDGRLLVDAVTRPFMPRILFPDKSVINESALTNEFTGLAVAGMSHGTQITIGYMGEAYIDFGQWGMMIEILAIGLAIGRSYKWLMQRRNSYGLLGMALGTVVLMQTALFENSTAKLVGGYAVSMLVAWVVVSFVTPQFIPWLRAPKRLGPTRG